jgi:serine/threonine protein kinase
MTTSIHNTPASNLLRAMTPRTRAAVEDRARRLHTQDGARQWLASVCGGLSKDSTDTVDLPRVDRSGLLERALFADGASPELAGIVGKMTPVADPTEAQTLTPAGRRETDRGQGASRATRPGRALEPGDAVGRYVVQRPLGRGAYGAVYRAADPVSGREVAIKVLSKSHADDSLMVRRFWLEGDILAELDHPGVVGIYDADVLPDGRPYLVLELLEGRTLARHLRQKGRLTLQEALPILRGLAEALDAVHDHGVVHRDLKPHNIFLVAGPDGQFEVRLLDFGVACNGAQMQTHAPKAWQTATGALLGTPHYMSPEQGSGIPVDHRSDIYGFGVLLYEMLTGNPPFVAKSLIEVLWKHQSVLATPVCEIVDAVVGLDAVVSDLLEKNRDARPSRLGPVVRRLEVLEARDSGC